GLADGGCTFPVALCASTTAVRVRGAAAAALRTAIANATEPCTADVPVRVPRRRSARLVAVARDATTRRRERARLALACRPAETRHAARAVVVTTDFETGLLATVGVAKPHLVGHPATPIHSDAVVRVAGDRVF